MKLKNVEDIYRLSPMQETMLFHASMQANRKDDVLFNQVHFKIIGAVCVDKFELCWQAILSRHQSLRSAFVFSGLKQPQQIVRKELVLPFQFVDLSARTDTEKTTQLKAMLRKDREHGFVLEKAPLMRISLLHFAENEYHFIWSTHHLVIDRWCIPILFDEFSALYNAQPEQTKGLPEAPQFKGYIAWLKAQDENNCNQYWQGRLSGFSRPTALTRQSTNQKTESDDAEVSALQLSKQTFDLLKKQCRQHALTLATMTKAAWSILLSSESASNDVVFGAVVSGRPAQIPGIESIVGSFVNNVPVRVKLSKDLQIIEWLRGIQREGVLQTKYEYTALSNLHQFSALEANQTLFDSILLWLSPAATDASKGLAFQPVSASMQTAFPLTVSIEENSLGIRFSLGIYNGYELSLPSGDLLAKLAEILQQLASITTDSQLGDLAAAGQTESDLSIADDQPNPLHSNAQKHSGKIGRERVSRAALIEFITQQWKQILQLESVNQDDDFFTLGGDSLKASQLLQKIEQLERKTIPILSLFQGRTINEMADIVLNQDWPVKAGIATAINKNGSQRPIFCIASPEVNTLGFANLAHHMGSDYPVYILQVPPIKDAIEEPEAGELPEMATDYIKGMLEAYPNGPYRIIGMCSGSQIAIEMARQMEQRGIELEFLGQINTWAFYTVSKLYYVEKLLNLYRYYTRRISQVFASKLSSINKSNSVKPVDETEKIESAQYQPLQVKEPENGYSIIDDVGWVYRMPQLNKISQKVTVFKLASQSFWRVNDQALGWGNQARETEVIALDGRFHMAILRESHVPQLAAKIRQCLPSTERS